MSTAPVMTMFRDPAISLWQSAIHSVLTKKIDPALESAAETAVDIAAHPVMLATVAAARQFVAPHEETPLGLEALECADLYLQLAVAKFLHQKDKADDLENEIRFSTCDPLWAECLTEYLAFLAEFGTQPYVRWTKLDDFVLDTLPENATIAFIGDWGTGMNDALGLLTQIQDSFHPDILIHLGDIYYSGTSPENQNHFLDQIHQVFGTSLKMIFTLDGNHDRYSGGKPYYRLIKTLGQPNSYFCLRNQNWQFVTMDTGYHDSDPFTVATNMTKLEPTEVEWHLDKIAPAGGGQTRGTILLSHHQFCSFQGVGDLDGKNQAVNPNLYSVFKNVLPNVNLWLWGHEHNLLVYEPYAGLQRGRCVGASAVPILKDQTVNSPASGLVPGPGEAGPPKVEAGTLLSENGEVFFHAYAIMKVDGPTAEISYYQVDSSKWRPGQPAPAASQPLFVDRLAAPAIRGTTATH